MAKANRDLFELDPPATTSPYLPANDFEDAHDIGMKSLESRKKSNLTPERKAAKDFEYIGDNSQKEDHEMDPTSLIVRPFVIIFSMRKTLSSLNTNSTKNLRR